MVRLKQVTDGATVKVLGRSSQLMLVQRSPLVQASVSLPRF